MQYRRKVTLNHPILLTCRAPNIDHIEENEFYSFLKDCGLLKPRDVLHSASMCEIRSVEVRVRDDHEPEEGQREILLSQKYRRLSRAKANEIFQAAITFSTGCADRLSLEAKKWNSSEKRRAEWRKIRKLRTILPCVEWALIQERLRCIDMLRTGTTRRIESVMEREKKYFDLGDAHRNPTGTCFAHFRGSGEIHMNNDRTLQMDFLGFIHALQQVARICSVMHKSVSEVRLFENFVTRYLRPEESSTDSPIKTSASSCVSANLAGPGKVPLFTAGISDSALQTIMCESSVASFLISNIGVIECIFGRYASNNENSLHFPVVAANVIDRKLEKDSPDGLKGHLRLQRMHWEEFWLFAKDMRILQVLPAGTIFDVYMASSKCTPLHCLTLARFSHALIRLSRLLYFGRGITNRDQSTMLDGLLEYMHRIIDARLLKDAQCEGHERLWYVKKLFEKPTGRTGQRYEGN
jgi:hypothetical protein